MIDRNTCLSLIHTSVLDDQLGYARAVSADWLATWPQDLEVSYLLAEIEVKEGFHETAIDRLQSIIAADPENQQAYALLARALRTLGDLEQSKMYRACVAVLSEKEVHVSRMPSWAISLRNAVQALQGGEWEQAASLAQNAVDEEPALSLPTLIAARANIMSGDHERAMELAQNGHKRWPECIYFRILIADNLLQSEDARLAVELLHKIAVDDPVGRFAEKFFGPDHPYQNLWPDHLVTSLSRPIPSNITAASGSSRLPSLCDAPKSAGETSVRDPVPQIKMPTGTEEKADVRKAESFPSPEPWESFQGPDPGGEDIDEGSGDAEELRDVREEFEQIASRINARLPKHDEEERVPAYILLSSRSHLIQLFGEEKFSRLDEAILSLVEAVRKRPGWTAYRIYVDDPSIMESFQLTPADPTNPWQIKLRLADLDVKLSQRAEMIGALFIVGGDGVVPFHMLPNPTNDDDDVIPSDNPYATTDENYFAPEWPVGRIPSDTNIDLLVRLVRKAADHHNLAARQRSPLQRIQRWLQDVLRKLLHLKPPSLGYSASIWRKASLSVFRTIGNPRTMITSPPAQVGALPGDLGKPAALSYYNLHGLEDAPEWFGQRDPLEDDVTSVEFPIALRPEDIINGGRAPELVFTEACYGANVLNKDSDTAISLKFLDTGSQAVVGSTKISYGSVTPPLIAADLLGRYFWQNVNRHLPVGESLRRAKLSLAAEMHRRQKFLDGEDQKTLISFVLFGDPLFTPSPSSQGRYPKTVIRKTFRPNQLKTACAIGKGEIKLGELDPPTLKKVKTILSDYLPGMSDAHGCVHMQQCECSGSDHACPTHQLGMKGIPGTENETMVVTFSKQVQDGDRAHPHFARLTLDQQGKVLKLAVSR